jgi:serine/threonine-protein phosphatase 2A regulatory subunit B'
MALREEARKNHEQSGSTEPLPRSLTETPPPRPEPYEEEQMTDVSIDMTANGFDASESFTLDRSMADDVVPNADPGIDRPPVSLLTRVAVVADLSAIVASQSHRPGSAGR